MSISLDIGVPPTFIERFAPDSIRQFGVAFEQLNGGKEMTININLDKHAIAPTRGHLADAGLDLYATKGAIVPAKASCTFDTGVHLEIPRGYAGFIKSKSGLNVNHNITADGVIDTGYTGSIVVKLYNHGDNDYEVQYGDKIAQLVLVQIAIPELKLDYIEDKSERGDNGFGSTGR